GTRDFSPVDWHRLTRSTRSSGAGHTGSSTLRLARAPHGRVAALDAGGSGETQSGGHGCGEVERLPLALVGRPGIPRRKQALSETAATGIGRALLYTGSDPRRDRFGARAGH